MSTITKEFTKEQLIAHITPKLARIKPDSQVNDNLRNEALMNKRVFEIALAALEAEPVAYVSQSNLDVLKRGHNDVLVKRTDDVARPVPLYTAPPAPVSVPDESAVELLATDLMKRIDKITGERHSVATLSSLRVSIVESCRAAMQSATTTQEVR